MNDNIKSNPSQMTNGMPGMPEKSGKNLGVMLGVLVVVLIIIIGGIFVFGKSSSSPENIKINDSTVPVQATETNVIRNEAGNTSDADAQIQADLDAQLKDVDYSF